MDLGTDTMLYVSDFKVPFPKPEGVPSFRVPQTAGIMDAFTKTASRFICSVFIVDSLHSPFPRSSAGSY